ncbi:helix-turn-helix domain-containing protein [Paenibacillus sp. YIM B09110]|uniref:helix-turn-helix domain-containing protein n=1 Tax=Paenibacillus sp. YIM B09110 TaxID=3126102 RepID=UPI00301CAC60
MDVKEAAEYLGISAWTVKNRIRTGVLRAYKQGNYWRIKREWLLDYERQLIEKKEGHSF